MNLKLLNSSMVYLIARTVCKEGRAEFKYLGGHLSWSQGEFFGQPLIFLDCEKVLDYLKNVVYSDKHRMDDLHASKEVVVVKRLAEVWDSRTINFYIYDIYTLENSWDDVEGGYNVA